MAAFAVPIILALYISKPERTLQEAILALTFASLALLFNIFKKAGQKKLRHLDVTLALYLEVLLVLVLVCQGSPIALDVLRRHFTSGLYLSFALMSGLPPLFGFAPFTLAYAKDKVKDPEVLARARFKHITVELAAFWSALFLVAALLAEMKLAGPGLTLLVLALGFSVTKAYPSLRRSI